MAGIVYVIGVFDLFHRGHLELLKKAKSLGNKLIVAVNGDEMVSSYKRKPFYSEEDRLELVRSCKYVDEAFIITGYDNKPFIEKYSIDIVVHGDDWNKESYMKQICVTEEYLKKQNVELCFVPYTKGISTSALIDRIASSVEIKNCFK